ncbi:MAG: aminopeptidase P family protein [Planctomycetota bacterium]
MPPTASRMKKPAAARAKTPPLLAGRLSAFRARLRAAALDAALVTEPVNVRYLTGFVGEDSWLLVFAAGHPIILSDSRFTTQIQRESPHSMTLIRKGAMSDAVKQAIGKRRVATLGLPEDDFTLSQRKKLAAAFRGTGVQLKPFADRLAEQRATKSDDEVKRIVRAGRIQQRAYEETLAFLEPGLTEAQVAAHLEYRMRDLGADGVSFPTIVAADANAALPHAIPGPRKIKKGSLVLIDWGAKFQGYCSDMTRVIALGKMKPKLREIFQICLDAQLAAIDVIAPGVSLRDVDEAARAVIRDAGYGEYFGHGLGHGLGLDIHEEPRLSPLAPEKGVLKPGHVVTVEPGIYLPGLGGVRIEDDVLVTDDAHCVLTDLPKDLPSAII